MLIESQQSGLEGAIPVQLRSFEASGAVIHCTAQLLKILAAEARSGYLTNSWGGVEIGGLLLGTREGVSITASERLGVECDHAFGPAFELSKEDRRKLAEFLQRIESAEGQKIVGWYRTTSKYPSMTEADTALAEEFFCEPGELALIIQRARKAEPVFRLFRNAGGGVWKHVVEFTLEKAETGPATECPPSPALEPIAAEVAPAADAGPQIEPDTVQCAPDGEDSAVTHAVECAVAYEAPVIATIERVAVESTFITREKHLEHFGLREDPFAPALDLRYWYASRTHGEATANLLYGIQARKGVMTLIGEAGSGKTLVLEHVTEGLKAAGVGYALLLNSRITTEEFFELLARDLYLPCQNFRKLQVLMALQEQVVTAGQRGSTTAILVDEAHRLEPHVLEEIDLLGNFQGRSGKLLQVVLSGQPELDAKLKAPNLRSLKQRIAIRAKICELNAAETAAYIQARLEKAGAADYSIFSEAIMREILELTGGIPRLINRIGGALLEIAYRQNKHTLTPELVYQASGSLHGQLSRTRRRAASV